MQRPKPASLEPIKLRAHHLLCIWTFRGFGYDNAFTDNMARVVKLCANMEQTVRITDGLDDICARCPHSNGQSCTKDIKKNAELIYSLDRSSSEALGVLTDAIYQMDELKAKFKTARAAGALGAVCINCEWYLTHCQELVCSGLSDVQAG